MDNNSKTPREVKIAKPENISDNLYSANPRIERAMKWLGAADLKNLPSEKIEIESGISLSTMERNLKEPADAKLETHRKYIDLQFVIEGTEVFGLKPASKCASVKIPYDESRDIEFFADACDSFETLTVGQFIILPPDTAHAPLIGKGIIKKGIFKILVD